MAKGTDLLSTHICTAIYQEVVRRRERKLGTKVVRLPMKLGAALTEDERQWLKNVVGILVSDFEGETEYAMPEFCEQIEN